jgi:hypothetical protein
METIVDHIGHFSKLMNYGIPLNVIEVNKSYLCNFNYYRDWWNDIVLIKEKHSGKVIAYLNKEDNKLYIKNKKSNY